MPPDLEWEALKERAAEETESRESLEKKVAEAGGDIDLSLRLARACIRDGRYATALSHYDTAEFLGNDAAHTERRLVALHLDDPVPPDNAA